MFADAMDDPVRIESRIWNELQLAPQPGHLWRLPVFGSSGHLRTVVLREVDVASRTLEFYTDVRSPKIQQLTTDNQCCWLIYDHTHKVQIRLDGSASIHTQDEIADQAWISCPDASRAAWLTPLPPGKNEAIKAVAREAPAQARVKFTVTRLRSS